MRPYRETDLPAVAAVYREAVRLFAPPLYTPGQVESWARFVDDHETLRTMVEGGFGLVVEGPAGIDAFAVLNPADYVSLLYCRVSRQGYASRLLQALETEARRLGVGRVHTAASLISHPLFLRHGYVVDSPERVERNGMAFDRYLMSKRL